MISFIQQSWHLLLAAIHLLLAIAATMHAVLWKRDSRAVIGWVGLVWLAPFIGAILYFAFGINRIRRKAASLKAGASRPLHHAPKLTPEEIARRDRFVSDHPGLSGLETLGRSLSGLPLTHGNAVAPLIDGDEAYPSMIAAIDRAERSVALASYIFDSDRAGEAFLQALVAAKARGVEVRVLIDDVGSHYSRPNMVRRLNEAGVTAARFLPTQLPMLRTANLRNHRKLLVVDGKTGLTGGTNIREGHWLALNPGFPVRCLHFALEGPVVAHLQDVFAEDWTFTTGEVLAGDAWFPPLKRHGEVWARGIADGPDEALDRVASLIIGALAVARKRVRIVTPYFLPDNAVAQALRVAALRGVRVEIFLPEKTNILLVQWATAAQLWQVLEKGCHVHFVPAPFDHSKLMTVDGIWSLIGSANWDPRSLRLNFEFNVECYDEALAGRLDRIIDQKAATARETSLAEVDARPLPIRLRDGLARLATPYL